MLLVILFRYYAVLKYEILIRSIIVKKKLLLIVSLFMVCLLSGCTKKCANCDNEIKKDSEIKIGDDYYCENCVEYCSFCNTPYLKDSKDFYTIKAHDGKRFSYSTEIQLFFSALEINFGLVKKYVRKYTPINHIYPNKSKTGYIFRK